MPLWIISGLIRSKIIIRRNGSMSRGNCLHAARVGLSQHLSSFPSQRVYSDSSPHAVSVHYHNHSGNDSVMHSGRRQQRVSLARVVQTDSCDTLATWGTLQSDSAASVDFGLSSHFGFTPYPDSPSKSSGTCVKGPAQPCSILHCAFLIREGVRFEGSRRGINQDSHMAVGGWHGPLPLQPSRVGCVSLLQTRTIFKTRGFQFRPVVYSAQLNCAGRIEIEPDQM